MSQQKTHQAVNDYNISIKLLFLPVHLFTGFIGTPDGSKTVLSWYCKNAASLFKLKVPSDLPINLLLLCPTVLMKVLLECPLEVLHVVLQKSQLQNSCMNFGSSRTLWLSYTFKLLLLGLESRDWHDIHNETVERDILDCGHMLMLLLFCFFSTSSRLPA